MKTLTAEEKLRQLGILEDWIKDYKFEYPRNSGSYYGSAIRFLHKSIRDGIVFYSGGWGWRLHTEYAQEIERKRHEYQSEINKAINP